MINDSKRESAVRKYALKQADLYGLGYEVETAYVNYRNDGLSVENAWFNALYDWDCLTYQEIMDGEFTIPNS